MCMRTPICGDEALHSVATVVQKYGCCSDTQFAKTSYMPYLKSSSLSGIAATAVTNACCTSRGAERNGRSKHSLIAATTQTRRLLSECPGLSCDMELRVSELPPSKSCS
ncbi:hypothetical protein Vafri_8579 [Volvox africanus]|uniref:Uncharacterized protein n=1 Tax=Volvox africanus TaxID=51714 RepID=A0A8J4B2K0_9CHLO|nr:hypothetical protein Vafri_8579 [Volvox africanus]